MGAVSKRSCRRARHDGACGLRPAGPAATAPASVSTAVGRDIDGLARHCGSGTECSRKGHAARLRRCRSANCRPREKRRCGGRKRGRRPVVAVPQASAARRARAAVPGPDHRQYPLDRCGRLTHQHRRLCITPASKSARCPVNCINMSCCDCGPINRGQHAHLFRIPQSSCASAHLMSCWSSDLMLNARQAWSSG